MSAANNTGRRGMYFYQRCRLSVWTGGSPPQKRQCVSEPQSPLGWLGPESDRWGWMAAREWRWDVGLLHSSRQQRIETEGRLHPLSPGRILSIALHLNPPSTVSFSTHIQTVHIGKKKKININKWMTEHAQSGTNPLTLSAGEIRVAERGCCLDLWVSDRKGWFVRTSWRRRWLEWQGSHGALYQRVKAWQQVETDEFT